MVKMKGNLITFTGKDAKMVLEGAKKSKMTPRKYVIMAVEAYARNVVFLDALDKWDEKKRIQGVQVRKEPVKLRREGTD